MKKNIINMTFDKTEISEDNIKKVIDILKIYKNSWADIFPFDNEKISDYEACEQVIKSLEEFLKNDVIKKTGAKLIMTTAEKIEIMNAYTEGKIIQIAVATSEEWDDWDEVTEPEWDWVNCKYRIKPESEYYAPYYNVEEFLTDATEYHYQKHYNCWLRNKEDKTIELITKFSFRNDYVYINETWHTMESLLEEYEYLDGEPCGRREE